MPIVHRRGLPDLNYEVTDFTDPWADAPVLLLQHGYGRSSKFWFQWVPYLSRFFRVVRPDLRGLGGSGKIEDLGDRGISIDDYVRDVGAIVEHLGVGPIHYCGESIGGMIGMAFAGAHPEQVRSLSLVSAPVCISEAAQRGYACGYDSWSQAVRVMGPEKWLHETNASTRFPPDMSPGFIHWYNRNVMDAGIDMLCAMADFAVSTDVTPFLAAIEAPVLVLYPDGGTIASGGQLDMLRHHVRDLRSVHLPTRYHMIHYILPALCARQVSCFAGSVDGRICDE